MGTTVKNLSFFHRLRNASRGISSALGLEASFRTELVMAILALYSTLYLRPQAIWLALVVVMIALVLAAELFNTALEHTLDALHPAQAEFVRIAKDCAAGAVLVLSLASVAVFVLMLCYG